MIKIINYFIQSIIIYIFLIIGRIIGLNLGRKLFSILFCVIGPLFKSKKIIKKNLKIFSQSASNINEKQIIKNMWKNYGMTFIEYVFLDYFLKNNSIVITDDKSNLSRIISEKDPVIFVSGHFANFELMSMEITKRNIPLATIYRPLNNFLLNPFMEYIRKRYVCRNQIQKGLRGVRDIVHYINKKNSIALMIDQRVSEGEKIDLFGEPAFTTTLPAKLSIKHKLDIVPVYIERKKDNSFKIEFQKRIQPKNFKNKIELTKELNRVLEKLITKNPSQWIWTHNRWK